MEEKEIEGRGGHCHHVPQGKGQYISVRGTSGQ